MGRCFTLICLLFIPTAVMAQLEVIVEPSNNGVRDNIQAFIGPVEAENRREMWRLARHATDQATKAAQALGFYHTRIRPDVTGSRDAPVLVLNVSLGQPILLDKVDIRVEGQGRETFQLPSSSRLRQGAVLNHGHYESYKTLISNQALRYGYFGGRFEQQELLVDVDNYQADHPGISIRRSLQAR